MANAKKCDRCGKLYDPAQIIDIYTHKEMRYGIIKDCHPQGEVRFDLCKDCRIDLAKWFNN